MAQSDKSVDHKADDHAPKTAPPSHAPDAAHPPVASSKEESHEIELPPPEGAAASPKKEKASVPVWLVIATLFVGGGWIAREKIVNNSVSSELTRATEKIDAYKNEMIKVGFTFSKKSGGEDTIDKRPERPSPLQITKAEPETPKVPDNQIKDAGTKDKPEVKPEPKTEPTPTKEEIEQLTIAKKAYANREFEKVLSIAKKHETHANRSLRLEFLTLIGDVHDQRKENKVAREYFTKANLLQDELAKEKK